MLNTRNNLFPLQNVTTSESIGLLTASATGLLTGFGSTKHRSKFEDEFANYVGAGEAIGFPSGRSSLAALLIANGVEPGGEVLLTGMTCEAVPQAVLAIGATYKWVDINLPLLAMNPELAADAVTPATQAIVVQHSFGLSVDLEPFRTLATQRNLAIIEDCCIALGSSYPDGTLIGTGEFDAFWSFEVTKTISAGWGGIAMVKDPERAARTRSIRDSAGKHGRVRSAQTLSQAAISAMCYRPQLTGLLAYVPPLLDKLGVFRSSELRTGGMQSQTPVESYGAAGPDSTWKYLIHQLKRLPQQLKRIQENNRVYIAALESVGVELPPAWLADTNVFLRMPLIVLEREAFEAHMWRHNVDTGRWLDWPVSVYNTQNAFNYSPGECPVGESVARSISNVPTHIAMSKKDIESASIAVADYFNANNDAVDFMNRFLNGDSE